ELKEAERKKPRMNSFIPGSSIANVLIHPPSQYALQKLSSFDFVKLWYFTLADHLDTEKHSNKSQADDTFGIYRIDNHLMVCSIASICTSRNVLPNHELPFPKFLRAKNCFLEYAKKADWPNENLDTLAKFFWFLETHPSLQLPLGEKPVLTYATQVRLDWHQELKAGRGYDISIINHCLLSSIMDEV
ncbi:hypothetical protein BS17DRAFT_856896, partial [Gyrodon lividus]